jgi:hypothetical protein
VFAVIGWKVFSEELAGCADEAGLLISGQASTNFSLRWVINGGAVEALETHTLEKTV